MTDHPFDPGTDGLCKRQDPHTPGGFPCDQGAEEHTHTQPPPKRTRKPKALPRWGIAVPDLEARREVLSPGSTLIECMVGNCEWALVLYPLIGQIQEESLALAAAYGIEEATAVISKDRARWTDAALREHLITHDVVEWAQTIRDIENANQAWDERCEYLKGEVERYGEMNRVLSQRLQEAEVRAGELLMQVAVAKAPRERIRDLPRDAMPLPMGVPAPVMDPMQERIVPSDKRAEGQVARKG